MLVAPRTEGWALPPGGQQARALVERGIAQMGGAARWQAVRSLHLHGLGHRYLLEQSERPAGPFVPEYERFSSLRDLVQRRQRTRVRTEGFGYAYHTVTVATDSVVAQQRGTRFAPAVSDAEEDAYLNPERLLFTAAAAADLRLGQDTLLQDVPHRVVAFTWRRWPVRVFLNAHTGLPTAREITRPVQDGVFFQVWGDIRLVALYSLWQLDPSGVRYPMQTDWVQHGQRTRTALVTQLTLNVATPADSFAVPRPVQQAYRACQSQRPSAVMVGSGRPAQEIAPGVHTLAGAWNVTVVKQADGLVIIEAPISSAYSAAVLAKAQQLYPGLPVKAVVSTSDAWPHLGGVREYVARRVPVYALDLNGPVLNQLLKSRFRTAPDSLQRRPVRRPDLRLVAGRTVLGQGVNRLELYPVRSESGERMLVVYFPTQQLLYGSDLVQVDPQGGFAFAQYVAELRARTEELGLAVKSVFAMHTSPLPWEKMVQATTPAP